jgi:UDP-3-O-[3-hydroxymyristoyl] glucosamine N-acyltransferase
MNSVVLFGAGSPVAVDVEESCARAGWTIVAAIRNVDGPIHVSEAVPVIAAPRRLAHPALLPLFSPANRRAAWRDAVARGAPAFPALVDPTAILPRRIAIEEGVYINAGCVLGGATTIRRFAFVNRGARLGHHLDLGEFASVGPGVVIAGQVTIGADVMIGAGAVILPGITIGAGAVIGAGTVVRRNVLPATVVTGRETA